MNSPMNSPSTHPPLRFAIVGAGVIGDIHAGAIATLAGAAEVVCVVDTEPGKAESLAGRHGVEGFSDDLAVTLGRQDIDAVIVCTPSGLHADIAVAALDAGKHVVIEKPIEVSLAAADRIIAAEQRSGKIATVISQHRFDKSTERALRAITSGSLGTITSGIASHAWWRGQSYYDSGDWRGTWDLDGGGAIMNQTVHTIDLLITALGAPVEIFAYTACLAHERIEVEDTAAAVLKFASGALGIIHGTTAAYPGLDAQLSIYGTKGSVVVAHDELVYLHETHGDAAEIAMGGYAAANQVTEEFAMRPEEFGLGKAHAAQLAHFVDAVRTGGPVRVTTKGARTTLAVILGLYESAASGKPVQL